MKIQLILTAMLLVISATAASAGERCRTRDFKGTYAFQGLGTDVAASSAGTPMALSGVLRADGKGGFVYWANVVSFIPPGSGAKTVIRSDLLQDARRAGSELRYEVDRNCRMRIFGKVQTPFGPRPLEIEGGLAAGGGKALMQLGAPTAIGTWTAERVGGSARRR